MELQRTRPRSPARADVVQVERDLGAATLRARFAGVVAALVDLVDGDDEGLVGDQAAMVLGCSWVLESLRSRGPVLLVVDDAQWADEASRSLLSALADRVAELAGFSRRRYARGGRRRTCRTGRGARRRPHPQGRVRKGSLEQPLPHSTRVKSRENTTSG